MEYKDLKELCTGIRENIIDYTAENGGYLASNLSNVEIAVVLHQISHHTLVRIGRNVIKIIRQIFQIFVAIVASFVSEMVLANRRDGFLRLQHFVTGFTMAPFR